MPPAKTPARGRAKKVTRPRRTPALTAAAREKRDIFIIDLFLSGHTQRAIGENPQVKLTAGRVNAIVKTELERATKDHILRNENAMVIYMARLEMLVREAFVHVTDEKDLKAIEVARRLLDQQSKIYGLADDEMRNPVPPMGDTELDESVEPVTELEKYRAQRNQVKVANGD